MTCDLRDIESVLRQGPGEGIWSEQYERVVGALVDAGKCWAYGNVPDGDVQVWRDALEGAVRTYLAHPDGGLREAALRTLTTYWDVPAYRDVARTMSLSDPDKDVRAAALAAWAGYYRASGDPSVMRDLAAVLRDATQDAEVRATAYRGLLGVSGYLDTAPSGAISKRLDVSDDVEAGVDWSLVARLTHPEIQVS